MPSSVRIDLTDNAEFEVKFGAAGTHDAPAINFFDSDEKNIIIHLVARMRDNKICLNNRVESTWNKEFSVPHQWLPGSELTLRIRLTGSKLSLIGSGIDVPDFNFPVGFSISDIASIGTYGSVSINRLDDIANPHSSSKSTDAPPAPISPSENVESVPVDHLLSQYFDDAFYRQQIPNFPAEEDALQHFCNIGWKKRLNPTRYFSVGYYLDTYPDIRTSGVDPFTHYLNFGKSEGRQPNESARNAIWNHFNEAHYRSQAPELRGLAPIDHYLYQGWRRGLRPNPDFDGDSYLRLNPDVRRLDRCPLIHYAENGQKEGRRPQLVSEPRMAVDPSLGTILFVGHDGIRAGAQLVLLDVVKWFAHHTSYPLQVILLDQGILCDEFASWADTLVLNKSDDTNSPPVRDFLAPRVAFTYINTVAAGRFGDAINAIPSLKSRPVVFHIHEMPDVIRVFSADFYKIINIATEIITVSEKAKASLAEAFNIPPKRINVLHAFISSRFAHEDDALAARLEERSRLGADGNTIVIAGCGTVYSRKGPDLFVDTALLILRRISNIDIRFVWYGEGEDRAALEASLRTTGFADRVTFTGFLPDAGRRLAAADIFFVSSREDPFPLVVLEAAEGGAPSVCFGPATGITEFILDDAGIVVDAIDPRLAADALIELIQNKRKRRQFGLCARLRMRDSYQAEQKVLELFVHLRKCLQIAPSVSVLVPAYNHHSYIMTRLHSIAAQSFKDLEIILLDDCSTDQTLDVVRAEFVDPRLSIITNESNSGSPFRQWQKGLSVTTAPYIWIAEGDDFCTDNFLEELVPLVRRDGYALAHAKTELTDGNGTPKPDALTPYLRRAHPTKYDADYTREGYVEVDESFAHLCSIVNASGLVFRKSAIDDAVLERARDFKMCGDWLIYLSMLRAGAVAYSVGATNFFRRHSESAVHKIEGSPAYFTERFDIAKYSVENFTLSKRTIGRMFAEIDNEWLRFADRNPGQHLSNFFDKAQILSIWAGSVPKRSMHIALYVHGALFSKGGIERLAAQLSHIWLRRGHKIDLYCRKWGGDKPVYPISEAVNIIPCFDEHNLPGSIAHMRVLLADNPPDIFVAMLSEWLFAPIVEAATGLGFPVAVSEHNDPWIICDKWWNTDDRNATFARADGIHLLLNRFTQSLPESLHSRIQVIPNGIRLDQPEIMPIPHASPRIIGVGRLAPQKRFDRLIKAFSQVSKKFPSWSLTIFGEGDERAELERLIAASPNPEQISLPGESDQIESEFAASDIFAISSEFEGFGIVVLESKRAGIPAIGYADCNGPNELIHHDVNGLLVGTSQKGDVANLAAALRKLMGNAELRHNMGAAAKQSIEGHDIENIGLIWEQWLLDLIKTRSTTDAWLQALSLPHYALPAPPEPPTIAEAIPEPESVESMPASPLRSPVELWLDTAAPTLLFSGSNDFRALTLSARGFPGSARVWGWISFKLQAHKDQIRLEMRPNQSTVPLFDPTQASESDKWGIVYRIPITPGHDPRQTARAGDMMKPRVVEDVFLLIKLAEQMLAADASLAPDHETAQWWIATLGGIVASTEEPLETSAV